MFFKQSDNFLTKECKDYINNIILSPNFPYYLEQYEPSVKEKFLNHVIVSRVEERNNRPYQNSFIYPEAIKIIECFFNKLNIKYSEIFRMCINLTYNNGSKGPVHQDHDFPHRQLLIYLNNADPKSKTVILNKSNKIVKEITPKKFRGICFENTPHYQYYPKKGERIVLITTFK